MKKHPIKSNVTLIYLLTLFLYSVTSYAEIQPTEHFIIHTNNSTPVSLTDTERQWLSAHPIAKLGGGPDWAPFNFIDKEGKYAGIANDYLTLISNKTGLDFSINIDKWSHQLQKIRTGQIDVIGAAYKTKEREEFVNYSSSYFDVLDYFFIRDDLDVKTLADLNGKRVAIPEKFAHAELIKKYFPKIKVVSVKTFSEAIDAVLENRADMLFDAYAALAYVLKKEGIGTIIPFKSVRKYGSNPIHVITRKDVPELTSIIQKGLDAITEQEKQIIYNRWLGVAPDDYKSTISLTAEEKKWLATHQTIRLGVDANWPPYEFIDQSGKFQGISSDIIKHIEQYLGVTFEINSNAVWSTTLEKIKKHEIDALSSVTQTIDRDKYLKFTTPYFSPLLAIYTKKGTTLIKSLDELNGKKVVIENQYFLHEQLQRDYPGITLVPVPTTIDALKKLSYGDVDAYVGNQGAANWVAEQHAISNLNVEPLTGLGETPLHLAVRNDWPILQRLLNKALATISTTDMRKIRHRWLGFSAAGKKLLLTREEHNWLEQHKIIRFTGDPNWLPYEAFDKNGNYIGIVADYLRIIEKKLDIKVKIIPSPSWEKSIEMIKSGKVDMISETSDSELSSYLTFSKPYLSSPVVIIMRSDENYIENIDELHQKKIAIIKAYGYVPAILKKYPDLNTLTVNTLQEGLNAVSTEKTDALFATLAQASFHISEMGFNNIRIVGKTEFNTQLAFGFQAEFSPLAPLFNRAIANINESEKQAILDRWGEHKFATRIDYKLLAEIISIMLLIIAFIIYWNRRLSKEVARRKEAESQMQVLIDAIPVQIIITSYKGDVLSANPQVLNDYNIKEKELHKFKISDFYNNPEDRNEILKELTTHGSVDKKIVDFKKLNGKVVSMMISVIMIKYNKERAFLTIAIDMTERLQLEAALQHSKDLAENSNRFKSQFLANMSHEIRTPMNAVIGMSHLALQTTLDKQQRDYIEKIKTSGQNLLTIINDILDFSKIEAGKLKIEKTDFLLDSVLDNLLSMIALQAEEKNLEIIFKRDINIVNALVGDPLRITQVLLNLAQNAIKFTDTGEISITAQLHKRRGNNLLIEFSVSDTGIGIEEDKLNDVLAPFIQEDSSTTRQYGGTGLGLSISQQLVKLMGGELTVKSKKGEGSTFSFILNMQAHKKATTLVDKSIAALNVLVIEDNHALTQVMIEMLTSFKFNVSTADSVELAYELLNTKNNRDSDKPFDLVMVDTHTNTQNNIDIAYHIKHELPLKHRPLVMLISSYAQANIASTLKSYGLDGLLIKPTTPSTLFESINECFQTKPSEIKLYQPIPEKLSGKVLLVEDNQINQQVAKEMLEKLGLIVCIAKDGEQAIERLKQTTFDLAFMDIQMPGIDGFETTRRIREELRNDYLPIIAMTAHAMTGDKERCLNAGMDDYISKPIDPEILSLKISQYLKSVDTSTIKNSRLPQTAEINWETDLPGINLQLGLSRSGGNVTLYLKLLQDFLDKYADTPEILKNYLDQGQKEEVYRLIHTLTGVSGTIGAEELQERLLEINTQLLDGTMPDDDELTNLKEAFKHTASNLESWLNRENMAIEKQLSPDTPHDLKLDTKILDEIIEQLSKGNPKAVKKLASINLQPLDRNTQKSVLLALDYTKTYNFSSAINELSNITLTADQ